MAVYTGRPLIVPPDVLIKSDCSEKRSSADTKQRRSSVGIWEYEGPGLPEMKTHLQTKRGQYPGERPAR